MYHSTMRSNVGCCSVSLSLNLNLNINLSLSVAPGASGGPCSNTCCGRSDCGIGSYSSNGSYSSSRNGGCSSNDSVLCVRAAAPGPLRQCAPSRTAFVLLCARASASAAGAGTDHAQDSQATGAADCRRQQARNCRRRWRTSLPGRVHVSLELSELSGPLLECMSLLQSGGQHLDRHLPLPAPTVRFPPLLQWVPPPAVLGLRVRGMYVYIYPCSARECAV